jgi:Metallo-peptidase family M12B Reprolysin-like/Thrombospondin type 3 repeat
LPADRKTNFLKSNKNPISMKRVLFYSLLLCTAASCQKDDSFQTETTDLINQQAASKKIETCDFLKGNYNRVRRGDISETNFTSKGRDRDRDGIADAADNCPSTYNPDQLDANKNGVGDACDNYSITTNPVAPVSSSSWVIFLDFDGQTVTTPYWNSGRTIDCTPSGFSAAEIANILTEVKMDYSIFPTIVVTADSAVYFSADAAKRQRVIVTENNSWYGGAGGVAYLNTISWGMDIPAFVFSKALGYNQKYNWEAISHEAGHTLGLNHQTKYDANCNFVADYNPGGNGEAPIMGVSYYQPVGKWWVGTAYSGCNTIQDDAKLIANKVR